MEHTETDLKELVGGITDIDDSTVSSDPSTEEVIQNTVHSCHDDITNKLNFQLVYSRLNTKKILPASSMRNFMRLLPPDSAGAQINNLCVLLQHFTMEEFVGFIDVVKETADEGGEAHEELAQALREKLTLFQSGQRTGISKAMQMQGGLDVPFEISVRGKAQNEPPRGISCGDCSRSCRIKFQNWRCKSWMPFHCAYCTPAILAVLCVFIFFACYPPLDSSAMTPQKTTCNNNYVVIEFNRNKPSWISEIGITIVNVTGAVIVFRDTNCSILSEARIGTSLQHNSWLGQPSKFFLEGSHISVRYHSGDHNFLFLKSLAAIQEYHNICKRFGDVGKYDICMNHNRTISYLCREGSALDHHLRGNVFCHMHSNSAELYVNVSDFYMLVLSSNDFPYPRIQGIQYTYNTSEIDSMQEKEVYNISNNPGGSSFVSVSLARAFSREEVNICMLVHSNCNENDDVKDIGYAIQRRRDVFVIPSLVVVLCVSLFLVLMCVHIYSVRQQNHHILEQQTDDE